MIRDAIVALGPWSWVVLGLLLAALELLAPGVFLIWFGLAAIVTGLLDAVFDLSWQTSAIIFALLSVVSVVAGRLATRRRGVHEAEQPFLNRRGAALVGRRFTLDAPITGGEGWVRVDDSVWRVVGQDCPAGTRVTVTGIDGANLVVVPDEDGGA